MAMTTMSPRMMTALAITATVFLLIANFGLWLERQIFNQDRFVQTAVQVIKTQEVRDAISEEIIDEAFADLPKLEQVAEEFLQSPLSALLDSDIVESATEEIAREIQVALTSKDPQAVAIDISGVTEPAKNIARVLPNLDKEIESAIRNLPDSIVLIEKGEVPSLYTMGTVFLPLGRISVVAGLAIIVGLIWVAVAGRLSRVLKILGSSLSIGAVIFLILIWALQSSILASVGGGNIQIIVSNIYEAFINLLVRQTFVMLLGGLLIIAGGYILDFFWRKRGLEAETSEPQERAA